MALRILVNIDVPDLRHATEFYTQAFQLEVVRDLSEHGVIELTGTSANIFLLEKKDGTKPVSNAEAVRDYRRHWTPVHLDFVVTDIEAAFDRVRAAGATVETGIVSHDWGRIAILADPFGNGFCLLEMSELGYDALL